MADLSVCYGHTNLYRLTKLSNQQCDVLMVILSRVCAPARQTIFMNTLALLFSYNCKYIHKNCNIFIVSVGLLCQGTSMKVKNINLMFEKSKQAVVCNQQWENSETSSSWTVQSNIYIILKHFEIIQ